MLGRRHCPAPADCARRASSSTGGARLSPPLPRAAATRTMQQPADRRRAPTTTTAGAATTSGPSSTSSAATDTSGALLLGNVRSSLIRQEDTIIFNLIERAQFARNDAVYRPGAVPVPPLTGASASAPPSSSSSLPAPSQCSLLEYVLRETERLHGSVRRYTSPDEHAFYPSDLPPLVLPPLDYPSSALHAPAERSINANARVLRAYLDVVLPLVTPAGDDSNYGSAATLDVLCLQALSKRIHYGMFVAEAKFRAAPERYGALIRARDGEGIMRLLTDEAVERRVVERVVRKAAAFGQDISDGAGGDTGAAAAAAAAAANAAAATADGGDGGSSGGKTFKVRPDAFGELYDKIVMPMTKDVQVEYLLRRLDGEDG